MAAYAAIFLVERYMPDVNLSCIRMAAMNLLAMREHSAGELKEKLGRKFAQPELIDEAVALLKEQGLQSDERFAEAFLVMRQRQGKGSSLIKMELRSRGVEEEIIQALVDESDPEWTALASEVHRKRFRQQPITPDERARHIRFLQSRGFAHRHIQAALGACSRDD